jgi:hypothetical protein
LSLRDRKREPGLRQGGDAPSHRLAGLVRTAGALGQRRALAIIPRAALADAGANWLFQLILDTAPGKACG